MFRRTSSDKARPPAAVYHCKECGSPLVAGRKPGVLVCSLCGLRYDQRELAQPSTGPVGPAPVNAGPQPQALDLARLSVAAPEIMATCQQALAWFEAHPTPQATELVNRLAAAIRQLEAANVPDK